jgi:hypothetical protein
VPEAGTVPPGTEVEARHAYVAPGTFALVVTATDDGFPAASASTQTSYAVAVPGAGNDCGLGGDAADAWNVGQSVAPPLGRCLGGTSLVDQGDWFDVYLEVGQRLTALLEQASTSYHILWILEPGGGGIGYSSILPGVTLSNSATASTAGWWHVGVEADPYYAAAPGGAYRLSISRS